MSKMAKYQLFCLECTCSTTWNDMDKEFKNSDSKSVTIIPKAMNYLKHQKKQSLKCCSNVKLCVMSNFKFE